MIKDRELVERFETELIKKEKADVDRNFQIVAALYSEACELGIFPLRDPLDGLEADIKLAKALNSVSKAP